MIAGIFLLAGCAQKAVQPTQKPITSTIIEKPLAEQGEAGKGGITEEELARAERERLLREKESMVDAILQDIGFDFDSYVIRSSEFAKIEGVGNWLKQEKTTKIVVEGHCDERGTIEYNLVLGQKRAEAIKDQLLKMGLDANRIKTVSFGKEVPVDPGHAEEAWAKNRRAHFKIDQKG
jgi:peptidoglycan-associated lipoprotein